MGKHASLDVTVNMVDIAVRVLVHVACEAKSYTTGVAARRRGKGQISTSVQEHADFGARFTRSMVDAHATDAASVDAHFYAVCISAAHVHAFTALDRVDFACCWRLMDNFLLILVHFDALSRGARWCCLHNDVGPGSTNWYGCWPSGHHPHRRSVDRHRYALDRA